jgi:hypothetical protein
MNTIEKIEQQLRQHDFGIEQAYSSMKRCRDDDHLEGETMWYSIALDREQARDLYHQQLLAALDSVE